MSTHPGEGARASAVLFCLAICGVLAAPSCAERSEATLGSLQQPPAPFVAPDASPEPMEAGLTRYCPSDECPSGYTTCPLSNFRCDANLLTDRKNCGACGAACPEDKANAAFECVDGACVLICKRELVHDNCDGIVDNGCETPLWQDNNNCRLCGNKCPAGTQCIDRGFFDIGCGCNSGDIYCTSTYPPCIDPSVGDRNCGACNKVCDPEEGGAPPPFANTYYGCVDSKCGAVKCSPHWGDCDADPKNGCEVPLDTRENCGACGLACAAGEECAYRIGSIGEPVLACVCPSGQTFCPMTEIGGIPAGRCYDLSSDNAACGTCDNGCLTYAGEACIFGVCRLRCFEGTADCNGSEGDGCEVNTNSDPSNCGGCGNTCDAIAGQACVGGKCVVKPCNEADGGGTQR